MNKPKMVMEQDGLTFEWSGGEYIEVTRDGFQATDVINVWDYAVGRARIITLHEFADKVRSYIEENYGLDYGKCDTCGCPYDPASRMNRCGECGDCEYCCQDEVN
jgi:hypothetical protein